MKLTIRNSPNKGRGVFTEAKIQKGTTIETAPVLVMPAAQGQHLDQTELYNYYYAWGQNQDEIAVVLGYGSLYNHSYQPSAVYRKDIASRTIEYSALRDIEPGEEITINYNGDPKDLSPLWFEVAG